MTGSTTQVTVGFGDDEASLAALEWALHRAAREGAAVHAVRAVTGGAADGITSGCAAGTDPAVVESETGALRHLARRVAAATGVPDAPPVSLSWCRGRPADVLLAAAHDALVVGRPARAGRTLRELLHHASCPISVAGTAGSGVDARRGRLVVVGVDAVPVACAGEALQGTVREALRHVRGGDRVVVVVGFVPAAERLDWPRGRRPSATVDEQVRAVRDASLAVVAPVAGAVRDGGDARGAGGPEVEVLSWPQEPTRAVIGAARDLGADELVLPVGGAWSPGRLLRLIRVAPCAVTVVPGPRGDGPAVAGRLIASPRSAPARGSAVTSGARGGGS
ncbi:universal stress protein [Actinomycetospora chibensis]|uniref:Universal stress protein n=1 Tax=Actinomycetospora chibensis TaxID=663606 RepID=A0ABV9RSZ2_9PSEU|nr:universal stress protein [Actinomycetospora chibensis]MDD7922273.1 universal stress protein [Actinomycetospora chibensis]